jgi:hypothetical protein
MPAKEADQRSEAKPDESKQGQDLCQNAGETTAAMLLSSKSAGVLENDKSKALIICRTGSIPYRFAMSFQLDAGFSTLQGTKISLKRPTANAEYRNSGRAEA